MVALVTGRHLLGIVAAIVHVMNRQNKRKGMNIAFTTNHILFPFTVCFEAKMVKYHIFWKFLAKKHCFGNKCPSTTFSRTRVSKTQVPHQFCHCGTAELEFVRLKKIMWNSSLVNSSTMQHNTRVHQARVPFYNKMLFFLFISKVLELTELEFLITFFFLGLLTNNHKHKNK